MMLVSESLDDDQHLRNWVAEERQGPMSQQFIGTVIGWIRDLWVRYPVA